MNHRSHSVVGIMSDDVFFIKNLLIFIYEKIFIKTDPLITVMKVDKAPLETYADIGGLEV